MRNQRFRQLLRDVINNAEHPDILGVEDFDNGEHGQSMCVKFADGIEIDLLVVSSSPPGGDNHNEPEKIVTKHDLAKR